MIAFNHSYRFVYRQSDSLSSSSIGFCLLSSVWVEPAGVKGLRVFPVLWVVLVGIEADVDHCSFGNGVPRERDAICSHFSYCARGWWIEPQNF